MKTLLLATRNTHKIQEIQGILTDAFRYLSLSDFPGAPSVIEDANSFAGNATKKAVELASWVSKTAQPKGEEILVLADDSGLEVDALDGAPGIYSARFANIDTGAAGNSSDANNNNKLLNLLANVPLEKRTARFRCVIAVTPIIPQQTDSAGSVCYADEAELRTELFDGTCEGRIDFSPRGQGGFGYDPLFIPNGFEISFGELGEAQKNKISHRANAIAKLRQHLLG